MDTGSAIYVVEDSIDRLKWRLVDHVQKRGYNGHSTESSTKVLVHYPELRASLFVTEAEYLLSVIDAVLAFILKDKVRTQL